MTLILLFLVFGFLAFAAPTEDTTRLAPDDELEDSRKLVAEIAFAAEKHLTQDIRFYQSSHDQSNPQPSQLSSDDSYYLEVPQPPSYSQSNLEASRPPPSYGQSNLEASQSFPDEESNSEASSLQPPSYRESRMRTSVPPSVSSDDQANIFFCIALRKIFGIKHTSCQRHKAERAAHDREIDELRSMVNF